MAASPATLHHDASASAAMTQPKDFGDRADIAMRIEELLPLRMIPRHAGRELAAILHVEEKAGDQPRRLRRALGPGKGG